MARHSVIALALLISAPALAEFDSGAFDTGAFDTNAFAFSGSPTVTVPNVVGQTLVNADTSLQAVALDTGSTSTTCSDQAANIVVSQAPPAGTVVPQGSLVDLIASNGTPCSGAGGKLRLRLDLRL